MWLNISITMQPSQVCDRIYSSHRDTPIPVPEGIRTCDSRWLTVTQGPSRRSRRIATPQLHHLSPLLHTILYKFCLHSHNTRWGLIFHEFKALVPKFGVAGRKANLEYLILGFESLYLDSNNRQQSSYPSWHICLASRLPAETCSAMLIMFCHSRPRRVANQMSRFSTHDAFYCISKQGSVVAFSSLGGYAI